MIILVAMLIPGPKSLLRLAKVLGRLSHSFNRLMMEPCSEISLSDIEHRPKTEKPEDETLPTAG